jgi:hypothetical protein
LASAAPARAVANELPGLQLLNLSTPAIAQALPLFLSLGIQWRLFNLLPAANHSTLSVRAVLAVRAAIRAPVVVKVTARPHFEA